MSTPKEFEYELSNSSLLIEHRNGTKLKDLFIEQMSNGLDRDNKTSDTVVSKRKAFTEESTHGFSTH